MTDGEGKIIKVYLTKNKKKITFPASQEKGGGWSEKEKEGRRRRKRKGRRRRKYN